MPRETRGQKVEVGWVERGECCGRKDEKKEEAKGHKKIALFDVCLQEASVEAGKIF